VRYTEARQEYRAAKSARKGIRKKENPVGYLEAKQRYEEAVQAMKDAGQSYFQEGAKGVFAEFPELVEFSWEQYTPYFNDGDACTFRALTDEDGVKITFNPASAVDAPTSLEYLSDDEEDEDDEYSGEGELTYEQIYDWDTQDGYRRFVRPGMERQAAALEKVVEFLESLEEETLLELFGDHASVAVGREGIEVTEYDSHD
jgi:hypothetical protein